MDLVLPSLSNSLFLQGAKDFGLQFQGKIANFVQEERALVRQFQAADLAVNGSSVGALLMAEQFAFQQARRESPRNSVSP